MFAFPTLTSQLFSSFASSAVPLEKTITFPLRNFHNFIYISHQPQTPTPFSLHFQHIRHNHGFSWLKGKAYPCWAVLALVGENSKINQYLFYMLNRTRALPRCRKYSESLSSTLSLRFTMEEGKGCQPRLAVRTSASLAENNFIVSGGGSVHEKQEMTVRSRSMYDLGLEIAELQEKSWFGGMMEFDEKQEGETSGCFSQLE